MRYLIGILLIAPYLCIIHLEWQHKKERRELYSRIMAGDLSEFEKFNASKSSNNSSKRVTNHLKKRVDEVYGNME